MNKYIVYCRSCNKKLHAESQKLRYCTFCKAKNRKGKRAATCKQCKIKFKYASPIKRIYCSLDCKNKSQVQNLYFQCKHCKKNIKTVASHSRAFCSNVCYRKYQREHITSDRVVPSSNLRLTIYQKYNYTCGFCKTVKHEEMRPLQLHHIDDNPINTVEENLIPLCASCHARTQRTRRSIMDTVLLDTNKNIEHLMSLSQLK